MTDYPNLNTDKKVQLRHILDQIREKKGTHLFTFVIEPKYVVRKLTELGYKATVKEVEGKRGKIEYELYTSGARKKSKNQLKVHVNMKGKNRTTRVVSNG